MKSFREIRDLILIGLSMLLYCVGWTIFLLPNHIMTGAVPGIASIIYWGFGVPVQIPYFAINGVLLLIALRVLGWRFCAKTVFAVCVLTFSLPILQDWGVQAHMLRDQPFMACVIGAVLCGSGVGLCFSANGSTGGTDIVAALVNKYRDVSLGRVLLICDLLIITTSYLVVKDWERVIYGYVVLFISSFCVDQVVNSRRRSVQFFIISDKYEQIAHRINDDPHRGCTVINGSGFFSGREVKILFVLAKSRESQKIFSIVDEEDPGAFVSQSAVIGVYGEGFDHFKVKHKK